MSNWISKHLGIRIDGHTLPNLLKNASPAAALVGGPAGLALAGGLSTLGDLGRGKNIGEAVQGGVKNAAIGAGLNAGVGALRSALSEGGLPAVGGTSAATSTTGAPLPMVTHGGLAMPSVPNLTTTTLKAADPRSVLAKALDGGRGLAEQAWNHKSEIGHGLEALSSIPGRQASSHLADLNADLLSQRLEEERYDFDRRRHRNERSGPAWSALGTALGTGLGSSPIAPNPYMPKMGGE